MVKWIRALTFSWALLMAGLLAIAAMLISCGGQARADVLSSGFGGYVIKRGDTTSGLIKNGIPGGGWVWTGMDGQDYVGMVDTAGLKIMQTGYAPKLFLPLVSDQSYYDLQTGTLSGSATFTRSSTGTYIGADHLIHTAAIDEPRYGYVNLTSTAYAGCLVEQSATNYCYKSEKFNDATYWSKVSLAVTLNSSSAPVYGNATTADKLTATALNGYTYQNVPNTDVSGSFDFSVYLRCHSSTVADTYISIGKPSEGYTNLTTPLTTAWRRYSAYGTYTGTVEKVLVRIFPNTTTIDIYAWGAQVEDGLFPTSYTGEVTNSAVTRSRDLLTVPLPSNFNADGAVLVDYTPEFGDGGGQNNKGIVDTGTIDLLYAKTSGSSQTVQSYDGTNAATNIACGTASQGYRLGLRWNTAATTMDNTSTMTNYVDGIQINTAAYKGSWQNTGPLRIGKGASAWYTRLIIFLRSAIEVPEW